MVTDHSMLNRRLAAVAAHEGMPVAIEMDAGHREEFQKLQNVPRETVMRARLLPALCLLVRVLARQLHQLAA